ncbi:SusC/RagA family TonB-linked outer membrane protein [Flavobacterium sedimenticola]|uniref:SusC/RagA family TonB-linked outer membrane protein n=1 Tax=Flavobacterium sedimenticola TaxID=3043286 RepID=A0ABT6XNE1_9FLAO|nr:SusC/RagA family TonB-linked outer membrane protein [Flavobacterium sedimenticola]MDI9256500.1 SusC/RagA family TonB-linked outer membrane protein [Flavobacterium sedimenticola]
MKTIYKKLLFLFLLLPFGAIAQSALSGVVVDGKSKQPLPGVNVIVQGAQNSTSTDFDGKFQLNGLKNGDKVVFSFIGYDSKTVTFSGQKSVNVSLDESANQLQEVVVQVGYGTVKKKDVTGSVATLTTKDFNKGTNVTAENLLNGRIAGVTVNSGGGAPGTGSQIRIRGGSSLSASNDPLIVIDGLPVTNSTNSGSTSILAALNPNDIESFNVLKDASASAIYGSRAANGVIIINTKKGSKKFGVEYNFQYGSGKLYNQVDVFNAKDFISQVEANTINGILSAGSTNLLGVDDPNTSLTDDLSTPGIIEGRILYNTDWQKAIYRRTDFVDNSLTVKGSLFNRIPARLTIGNTYQQGLRLTNHFNRNTASVVLNPNFFNDHLKLRFNANFANENNRFADGVEGTAIRFDPTKPIYDASSPYDGFFEYRNGNTTADFLNQVPRNPVAQLRQTYDTGMNNRVLGNFEIDYKFHFFPDLRAVVNLGFDEANGERTRKVGTTALTGFINGNTLYGTNEYSEATRRNKLLDAYFVYNKKFNKINFELTTGYSYQKFQVYGYNTFNVNNPTAQPPRAFANPDEVLLGFFGRTNISINDKYLFTFSLRRDGSSRFSDANRWLNSPAAAFAWRFGQDLFKDSKVVSDMKLRLGWGVTGQQDIPVGDFYLERYNVGDPNSQYYFASSPYPVGIPAPRNPNLKWESTTTYNLGLDYGLFDDRITGAIDAFYKKTNDLYFGDTPYADGSNFSNSGPANIGSFSTKGIEFSLNADVIKRDNLNWNINFNATKFERRIDELPAGSDVFFGQAGGTGGTVQIHREGYTPGSFFVYKQLYSTDGSPIEGAFADLNGDGIINGDDRYIYKNPDPDLVLGFASSFNYKNLDFSFNMRANLGNRIYNALKANRAYRALLKPDAELGNVLTSVLDTNFTNVNGENVISDIYIENGSFLRMDNITVGYTFPKWLDGKASLRLFTGVQNAFIITDYDGLDPEINNGRDDTIYPRQRQFLFGANVKF